ncbi:SCO family protein [Thermoflexus sp.]|uniref:SCO family protein n=1 Tax=Thermoflexus sp. TaxID=1969742 RepID=UPI0025CDE3EE|nr:SCO family protein [Thermoflexus sp.]MDW8180311.1 SCO family protein [Anaerolineae bacterium]MCS6962916.1 SCO family protein [Thermoflexus sp.]MCS7350860.1 SCO family protein [Thermoflexus sp.]MCX7690250.1 SCO family protein [Thermoflexus sp.]MDW8186189.1 SCO family protein [Anaerolineae bacterium]
MPRWFWLGVGIGLLFVAAAGAVKIAMDVRAESLPVYMTVPDWPFIDQDGRTFWLGQTRGKVVVLGMIYTHCPDICPLITAQMMELQKQVAAAGLSDEVFFVTITFDPERDTPEVLRRYAQVRKVDLRNWVFLTGDPSTIRHLTEVLGIYTERVYMVQGTPVSGTPSATGSEVTYFINHTDRIFLVDRQGQVRALLPGSRTETKDAMEKIRRLVRERSAS